MEATLSTYGGVCKKKTQPVGCDAAFTAFMVAFAGLPGER
jgi:hypothetical protein